MVSEERDLLSLLQENKGTVSSALGKELARKVLGGEGAILTDALALVTYDGLNPKSKNIRAGAAKIIEKVAEVQPERVAPYLHELLPALNAPEPQTRWMLMMAFGYCAQVNPDDARKAIPLAKDMICAGQGTCLSGAAELALGRIGAVSPGEAKQVFAILSEAWPGALRNDIDEIMEAFLMLFDNLDEADRQKAKALARQYEHDPQQSTCRRVRKILKKQG